MNLRTVRTRLIWLLLIIFIWSSWLTGQVAAVANENSADDLPAFVSLVINEIKLGGASEPKEYVTFFNAGNEEAFLNGWVLEYAKPAFDSQFCSAASWEDHDTSSVISVTELSGSLSAGAVSTPISRQLNDNGAGSLRLVNALDPEQVIVHDLVGWGGDAPCSEGLSATAPSSNQSIARYLDCEDNLPVDSDSNQSDFTPSHPPHPGALSDIYRYPCGSSTACEGIVLSEILPNPAGADNGQEFIELHNLTAEIVELNGCGLQINDDAIYWFDEAESMNAGQHRAFYDNQIGQTLPNAAGGSAYLLSGELEELSATTYPANLEDDVAWARFGATSWQTTYRPTPNAGNVLLAAEPCPSGQKRNPDTNRCVSTQSSGSTLKPCHPGQTRNPATNRCRSAVSTSALKPCQADQQRNPATNRCRQINSTSSLKPCKEDQYRNPETNRCKKTATSTLKPCNPGQARNPATNRCRKVEGLSTADVNGVQDVVAPSKNSLLSWWMAGAALVGAVGYGAFEWRQELANALAGVKNRFTIGGPK